MSLETARQHAPATERNRQPILDVLQQVLPKQGTVLEIASGTGEHAVFFAPRLKHLDWLPSEPTLERIESIKAWQAAKPSANLLPPIELDVNQQPWPVESAQKAISTDQPVQKPITAIVNINMIHISPWAACQQLMAGAQRILPIGGVLYLYGPFRQKDKPFAPSNEAFDQMLRDRNPNWGIRELTKICHLAEQNNLKHSKTLSMPANNLSVIFHRVESSQ